MALDPDEYGRQRAQSWLASCLAEEEALRAEKARLEWLSTGRGGYIPYKRYNIYYGMCQPDYPRRRVPNADKSWEDTVADLLTRMPPL